MRLRPLAVALSIGMTALVSSTVPANSATSLSTSSKVGGACKVAGQTSSDASGKGATKLVCRKTAKGKLAWTRSSSTGSPASSTLPASIGTSATFLSRPSVTTAVATAALLNAQGANGFAYIGPFFIGAVSHELFIKSQTATAYRYEVIEKPADASSAAGFMSLLATKGKQGLLYKAPLLLASDFGKTYLLFVASSAKKTTYSYRNADWPTDEPTMLSQLNRNGGEGYGYIGDLIPDPQKFTVGFRLFAKDDKATNTFTYALNPQLNDRAKFLAEATALGKDRFTWKGGYVFAAGTPEMRTWLLYERSSATANAVTYSFDAPTPTTIENLVSKANERAKLGEVLWGQYQFGPETVSIYVNGPLTNLPLVGVVIP
jgi:hypothetical protein